MTGRSPPNSTSWTDQVWSVAVEATFPALNAALDLWRCRDRWPFPHPKVGECEHCEVTQIGGVERCDVRGRTVAFRQLGAGPVVVLVHGLAGTMETWDRVIEDLSSSCTVVAMDLPGHGRSAAPAGDYSLEAYASCVRDLLDALGHRVATVVGHSLGGGVAMQFAHDYPERCERLVLVSSGGLGADVSIALRAAALPGSEHVVALIANRYLIAAATIVSRLASAVGIPRSGASLSPCGPAKRSPMRRAAGRSSARCVVSSTIAASASAPRATST